MRTPEQRVASEDSFLLKPKEVKRWASELPIANTGETARQTYKTLVAFNRIQVPALVRAEITELFREPVRYINTNMTRHYMDVGFPLNSKARKAAQLAIELCNEVAHSYKSIIKDQLAAENAEFDQKLVIVAIHRALQYLGQSMFHNFLVYGEYSPGIWREIHFLYAWAAQNHIHNIPVKESTKRKWRQKNRSIEELYKGYLLLATVSPQRLRQSQIRRIHDKIPLWAKYTKIKKPHETTHNSGIFFVNLWSDAPPQKAISQHEKTDSRFRAFDLNEILSNVRQDYDASDWESPSRVSEGTDLLPKSLLRLLIRGWNKSLQRKFARTQMKLTLDVVVGLSNLFRVLEAENHPAQDEKDKKPKDMTVEGTAGSLNWNDSVFSTLAVASPVNSQHGDSIFADSMSVASTLLGEQPAASWAQPAASAIEDLFSVLTYNESAEGYCLDWQGSIPPKVRVGDILGIRSERNPGEYSLGITRWLRYRDENKLFLGVQVISNHVSVARLAPAGLGSNKQSVQSRCLLLTGDGIDKDQQGIITNTKTYPVGTILTLITDFGEHQIKLSEWVESSNIFIHYHFEYLEGRDKVSDEAQDNGSNKNDFNKLWNDL